MKKKYAVIGLGNFGFHAARSLYEEGHEVVAIDLDKGRVHAIGNHCTEAIFMDATDKERLGALGLESMDAVIVSTGTQISISILICLYLQEIGVKKILVKALDEDHAKVLKKVGASRSSIPKRTWPNGWPAVCPRPTSSISPPWPRITAWSRSNRPGTSSAKPCGTLICEPNTAST